MNKFIQAITNLDLTAVENLLQRPKWRNWAEPSGKNALHYLCGRKSTGSREEDLSLEILKLLLKSGMDINSPHRIEGANCDAFPATPLWYAYTRARNESLYKYLLKMGADPSGCWWAIAWYDDVKAGEVWLKHGAKIDKNPTLDELFLGTFQWKKCAFAKWLLNKRADVNARGPDGITALMLAVKRKDADSIRWLVDAGADADLENEHGLSARRIAESKGPRRLLDLLVRKLA